MYAYVYIYTATDFLKIKLHLISISMYCGHFSPWFVEFNVKDCQHYKIHENCDYNDHIRFLLISLKYIQILLLYFLKVHLTSLLWSI